MHNINSNEAYLLGLLLGKGDILDRENGDVRLVLSIKYRKPSVHAVREDNIHYNRPNNEVERTIETELINDFQKIKETIMNEWGLSSDIDINTSDIGTWSKKQVNLTTEWFCSKNTRLNEIFNVPQIERGILLSFPEHLGIEHDYEKSLGFVQGVCDAASLPSTNASSAYGGHGSPRIQIEPDQDRWLLQIYLCRIFQIGLSIPVSNINWGHPQIRTSWVGQNHQFRVKLDVIPDYIQLYRLRFKQRFYNTLYADSNVRFNSINARKLCPHNRKVRNGEVIEISIDRMYPDLNHERLPEQLKSKDVNVKHKKSIIVCYLMGCQQCRDYFEVNVNE